MRRRNALAIAAMVAAAVLIGCGGGGGTASNEEPCEVPSAIPDRGRIPEAFPITEIATLTQAKGRGDTLSAVAITETQIVELYPILSRSLLDAGYEILSGDNEGFEAEIFFSQGENMLGTYLLRQGPCEGYNTIRLSIRETA